MKRLVVFAVAGTGVLATASPALADYPPGDNLITVSDVTPCPGQTVTVEAGDFAPGSTVTVTLADAVLGTPVADDSGNVSLEVTLSAAQAQGAHTITASGTGEDDGAALTLSASVNVGPCEEVPPTTAPPSSSGGGGDSNLPTTGSDSTMNLLKVGGGLAAAGGVLVALAATRRRRSAPAV
jgi:hypothetical protein